MNRTWLAAGLLGQIVFLSIAASARSSSLKDSLLTSFHKEAPRGWKELREYNYGLSGTFTELIEPLSGMPATVHAKITHEVKGSPSGFLDHRIEESDGNVFEYIEGINSEYTFLIERSKTSKLWKINRLTRDKKYMETLIETYAKPLFVSHSIDGQDLAWTAAQPGFRVNKLTPVKENGLDLVVLDFNSSAYQRKDYQIRSGRVWLEPAKRWAVHRFDLELFLDAPATSSGKVEYDGQVEGYSVPKSYVFDYKAKETDQGLFHKRRSTSFELSKGVVPAAEFRLPAYGLPEPFDSPRRSTWPAWMWPVLLAIICLAISASLKIAARSRSSTNSVTS